MKYPQLVSPRAVNAISDWLVSRLEQLGVESPQIYTRLLLSLLQSSVQVNDPIEFSNLEAFFANRKGGHKRFHLPSDTETLKKLNAVQCLREIVSNEQETSTIEELVEELCEKLKDIEKQTQNLSDEERFLIETQLNTDSLIQQNQVNTQLPQQQQQQQQNSSCSSISSNHTRHHNHHHHQNNHQHLTQQNFTQILNNSQNSISNCETKQRNHVSAASTSSSSSSTTAAAEALNDLDNDPKKRYFRAFPALSKEMEDSFRIWRRNAKSLTWPVVGRSIATDNSSTASASLSSSSASSIISSSNFGANSNSAGGIAADKSVEKKLKVENKVVVSAKGTVGGLTGCVNNIGGSDVQQQQQQQYQHQGAVAAVSVKKSKSKRRRNQTLCKGKPIQNIRKLSVGTTTSSNSAAANKYHHYTHHRKSSPAWDTDFKGCWEMGPDLIKEFLSRQNGGHKRNRSGSDSMDHEEHNEHKILNEMSSTSSKKEDKPIMKRYIDLSFCCDDDEDDEEEQEVEHDDQHHDDQHHHYTEDGVDYVDEDYDDSTLASCSELTMDCPNPNPKRLYQREAHGQKSLTFGPAFVFEGDNTLLNDSSNSVDPLDFQQFKAKFNSSVEALWKDVEPATQQANSLNEDKSLNVNNSLGGGGISSAFYATTSLNALAPFKKDLWNFWSNYNQQHYDQINIDNNNANTKLSATASSSSMVTNTRLDDSSASSGAGADIANSSDYFSMPSNLDDFDKSVGGVRRLTEAGASLGANTPSINVFLQNSIWSTSGDCVDAIGGSNSAVDTDESFLFKVWHSNKKLSQLDVGSGIGGEKLNSLAVADNEDLSTNDFTKPKESSSSSLNNPNLGANLQFTPYQNLKWSEGINAGPPYSSLRSHANANHNELDPTSLRTDNNFASFSSVANISGATWEAPAYGQNAQPDLKSWCASNPMSLTEMYGNDVCDSIVNPSGEEDGDLNSSELGLVGPAVTLPNHCANTSGFVAYSRIKQCGLVQPKPLQPPTAPRLPKDFFRAGAEEENLLNSERTHFHPIENFVDGHTFDISDALDTIEFERTSSGLLRYDSEEYLEYTRNDIYMADEEVATSSTNLLKYNLKSNEQEEDKSEKFIIKFRVKRSFEMACQTESEYFQLAAAKMTELPSTSSLAGSVSTFSSPSPLEVTNMFHNTFSLSRQANNEAIMAAVTKAVAAAAKAASDNHLNAGHFCWLPNNSNTQTGATANNSTSSALNMETNPLWLNENSLGDEVDFCKIQTVQHQQMAQNWSMQELEKQCHQRQHQQPCQQDIERKFPSSVDLERHEENSLDSNSLHTLWGMCAVCNSCGDYGKSMPANRLLRDELQLEADEIMSDLRYMQDLYIGESASLNENPGEDNVLGNKEKISEDKLFNQEMEVDNKNPWNMIDNEALAKPHDPAQVTMLQKVNQLIEDLLKPENAGSLLRDAEQFDYEGNKEKDLKQSWNLTTKDHLNSKNLWQFTEKEEDNIWQHKPLKESLDRKEDMEKAESFMKPMKLLKQVGGALTEDQQYKESLNWEHDNLAKIWQQKNREIKSKNTPEGVLESLSGSEKEKLKEILREDFKQDLKQDFEEIKESPLLETQQVVEEKNLKNLCNTKGGLLTPPSTLSGNTYKRVQQFLNNSAAKFKINANRKRRHSASQNFYQQQNQQQQQQQQNFQQQQKELLYSGNNTNFSLKVNNNINNNNNNNITDLNAYKIKLNETLKLAKEQQQQLQQQESLNFKNFSNKASVEEEKPSKQTIITCKYWTTATNGTQNSLDSAAAAMMLLAAASNVNNINASNAHNANSMSTTTTHEGFDVEDVMLDENIFGNTFSCLIDKNASILKHMTMMTRPLTR